jgi:mono/diheme cytochrome c family protein
VRPSRSLIAGIAAAALVGSPASAQGPSPGVAAGRVLYLSYCASCHGVSGEGNGPVAESLRQPPTDLTRLAERHGTPLPRQELAEFIDGRRDVAAHGPRDMPVWGRRFVEPSPGGPSSEPVADEAIQRLLDFLASIQRFDSAAR